MQMRVELNKPTLSLLIGLVMSLCCGIAPFARAGEEKGPLAVRNQFPPHLMFLTPIPQSARMPADGELRGSLAIDYSSVFFYEKSTTWSTLVDMEMAVLEMTLDYGLTDRMAVGLRLPFVSMNAGFMDQPLETFHAAFGLPNYDKHLRPKDDFAYDLKKDGQSWLDPESGGINLADITTEVKFAVAKSQGNDPAAISLSYQLKLPTGDSDHGFGSGAIDHGFFLPIQVHVDPYIFYLTPGYIWVADPKTKGPGVRARDIQSFFLGGEYLLTSAISLLTQISFYTSPLEKTGIEKLDDGSLELAVGFQWQITPELNFEFAFCEDLTRSVPDFNLHGRVIRYFF
jgi:hypothetical protein